ncbi:hypothetical protein OHD16_11045 [Sphingobacterium sp. ML3W]|uniref:hypothetical protein n=1 Tax=Sphingobacterium sp. ML3W TaxID=1538644 RepID=UPI00249BB81A|nr:hypothetical protein [Sphingobacterium sp. ML3W]WFA80499.1 hypothetical protein OGI71_04190 [Sphingobacterium sp. ML3W]
MKWMFCILIFVTMETNATFAQTYLRNGVYELADIISSDTIGNGREKMLTFEKKIIRRTLTVSNDTICYQIGENTQTPAASFGIQADYCLKLKPRNNGFSAENKTVKLKLVILDDATISMEVLAGKANYFYSGGQYFKRVIAIPPERRTLTFKRVLTAEDIEKLWEQEQ